jgi:hypothetical protein
MHGSSIDDDESEDGSTTEHSQNSDDSEDISVSIRTKKRDRRLVLKSDEDDEDSDEELEGLANGSNSISSHEDEKRDTKRRAKRRRGESTSSNAKISRTNEDDLRIIHMKEIEKRSWAYIARRFSGRTNVACMRRYNSYLSKGVKRARWSAADDKRIMQMREIEKKSWIDIAEHFPGKKSVTCNVRYNSRLRKCAKQPARGR